jgi:nucleotide-binding universal stress UspA family protein
MKIVLATDGSSFSQLAVEKCCELVRLRVGTKVKVIAVYETQTVVAAEPFAISAEFYQQMTEIARQNAEFAADRAVEQLRAACGGADMEIEREVALGNPAEMILQAADEFGADLLIVGSHGRGFWGRLTLGSVSDAVVHHAKCPVLVARPGPAK